MPFVWVAPGVTKAGGVSQRPVDLMSLYPTLCDLAAIEKPAHVEGVSIKPLLADPAAEWRHLALTTHGRKNHAVRSENWRYIRYEDGTEELYDHSQDEFEWTNVAGDSTHAKVKAHMQQGLPAKDADNVPDNGGNPAGGRGQKRGGKRAAAPRN